MAARGNTVTQIGNVTRDPELRYTEKGDAVLTLGVAVDNGYYNRDDKEWVEKPSFFDVVCWRELAENVAETIEKGTRVVVVGHLEQRSWQNDEGENRYKVEIAAEDVAPSLRFAKAEVTKVKKGEGGGSKSKSNSNDPGPTPPGYDDEEPF